MLARNCFVLRPGFRMAAQVEGQTHASQRGNFPRAREILLLTAAPAVHEQYTRNLGAGRDQRSGNVAVADCDFDHLVTGWHKARYARTWS